MRKDPWYIWLSVFALVFFLAVETFRFMSEFLQRKWDQQKWAKYCGHVFFIWFVLIMVINIAAGILFSALANAMPALKTLFEAIQFLIFYLSGVFATAKHCGWKRKNALVE